jgi:hypothetical protein
MKQMIKRGLADARAFQKSIQGQVARTAQVFDIILGKAHI